MKQANIAPIRFEANKFSMRIQRTLQLHFKLLNFLFLSLSEPPLSLILFRTSRSYEI
jgi:hypothetical protein